MSITAVFILAKRWPKLKHLSPDEWINKMQYSHMTEYYWAMKKELTTDMCHHMDGP